MAEYISDIKYYGPDMDYYYYAKNYVNNDLIYAYMSNNQLEEGERPTIEGVSNIVELKIGSSGGLSRNDIITEIKYRNCEDVEVTYNISDFLELCDSIYTNYCTGNDQGINQMAMILYYNN